MRQSEREMGCTSSKDQTSAGGGGAPSSAPPASATGVFKPTEVNYIYKEEGLVFLFRFCLSLLSVSQLMYTVIGTEAYMFHFSCSHGKIKGAFYCCSLSVSLQIHQNIQFMFGLAIDMESCASSATVGIARPYLLLTTRHVRVGVAGLDLFISGQTGRWVREKWREYGN